jgi:Tol biopolymer transport system component
MLAMALLSMVVLAFPTAGGATFPGVNGEIAFDSNRDGNEEIYVINPDGTGETRLTNDPASDHNPRWSPDGTKIAFNSSRAGNTDVWVMNADGTGLTNLTNNPAEDFSPAWSPDGTKIAFGSDRDGARDIYVMNADGTGATRLTNGTGFGGGISWSPNGTKIVFANFRDGFSAIYTMNADGTGETQLTNNPEGDGSPDWSPDGMKIAFTRTQGGNAQIYVMNADGTGQMNLTNSSSFDFIPSWSPDGTKMAFTSNRDGNPNIYVMNADGTAQTRITTNSAADLRPSWGPVPGIAPTSTPGKVSLGGFIDSAGNIVNGSELLLQHGPNAGGKATFGGNVQFASGNPNPTGNVRYIDHVTNDDIKATSFSLLLIGDGPCGTNTHATIKGKATVNGVPDQDLTIDVDDCGSAPVPAPDTLTIMTGPSEVYANGGPLMGGNIQVKKAQ